MTTMRNQSSLLRRLDLTTLQLVVAIAEEANLTRAAIREGIAASAASRRLCDLEQDLGLELFARTPKGMQLTPAGDTLLLHARRMLLDAEALRVELHEYGQGVRGHIRILANISSIVAFLPEDLESFFSRHNDLRVELEERPSQRVIKGIDEGWADFGICSRDADLMGLETMVYRRDELVVLMRPDHPLAGTGPFAFANTLEFEHIGLHAESAVFARSQAAAHGAARPMRRRIHVPSYDAMCRMVQANLGVAVLPAPVYEVVGRALGLHAERLTDEWAEREVVIVMRDSRTLSVAATLLLEHLLSGVPA